MNSPHEITSAPDSNPWCRTYIPDPVEEELWRQELERKREARRQLIRRQALYAAQALLRVADVVQEHPGDEDCQPGEHHLPEREIADILEPFFATLCP